jgi:hypothetical protein
MASDNSRPFASSLQPAVARQATVLRGAQKIRACLERLLGERVSLPTVYHWIRSGDLRVGKIGGRFTATEESLRQDLLRGLVEAPAAAGQADADDVAIAEAVTADDIAEAARQLRLHPRVNLAATTAPGAPGRRRRPQRRQSSREETLNRQLPGGSGQSRASATLGFKRRLVSPPGRTGAIVT